MKRWNVKDILIAVAFNLILIMLMRLVLYILQNAALETMTAMLIFCMVPFVFSAAFTYMIKSKGRRLWIAELILAVLAALIVLYSKKPFAPGFMVPELMSAEELGFSLLFVFLHCIGLLAGSAAGIFIWYLKSKGGER